MGSKKVSKSKDLELALDTMKSFSDLYNKELRTVSFPNTNRIQWSVEFDYHKSVDEELFPGCHFSPCGSWSVELDYDLVTSELSMKIRAMTAYWHPISITIDRRLYPFFEAIDNILVGIKVLIQNEVNRLKNDKEVELEDIKLGRVQKVSTI